MQPDLIEYVAGGKKESVKFSLVESKRSSNIGLDKGLSKSLALTQQGSHSNLRESSASSNKNLGERCFHTDCHEQGNCSKTAFKSQTSQADHQKLYTSKILGPSRQGVTLGLGNLTSLLRIDPGMALWPKWHSAKSATGRTLTQEEHQVSTRQEVMCTILVFVYFFGMLSVSKPNWSTFPLPTDTIPPALFLLQ